MCGKAGTEFWKVIQCDHWWMPKLDRKNIVLLKRIQDQVAELNPDQKMIFLHYIIHQEVLGKCVLKISHVVYTVTKLVNFIRAKSMWISLNCKIKNGWLILPSPWTSWPSWMNRIPNYKWRAFLHIRCTALSKPPREIYLQLELINLQSHTVIGELFKTMSLMRFYASLDEQNFPKIRRHAQKMFVLFGSTYVCEQTCSVMKYKKSRHRSSLTDSHLSAILRIATSATIPDRTTLVNAHQKRHSSHWLSSLNVMLSSLSLFLVFLCIPVNKSSVGSVECTVYFSLCVVHCMFNHENTSQKENMDVVYFCAC